jgi:hypothetical protein
MGAVLHPRRTFAAFLRGCASQTLYHHGLTPQVLDSDVWQLRRAVLPEAVPRACLRHTLVYLRLVLASLVWTASPLLALAAALSLP